MSLLQKRKRPESKPAGGIAESDRVVLNVIKSKGNKAAWIRDIKKETNLPDPIINKCLKNLQASALIKEVVHARFKGKHYIAAEFEPSQDITGGLWYVDGKLDTAFIDQLKNLCLKIIRKLKVATAEGVYDFFKTNRLTNTECTSQQISEVLRSMVLDDVIIDVNSTGHREYHSIPIGMVCYRCPEGKLDQRPKTGAMASVPCGVCPRIRQCMSDGVISPSTCVYYAKWLDF